MTDPRKHRADLVAIRGHKGDVRSDGDGDRPNARQGFKPAGIGMVGDDILPAPMDRRLARTTAGHRQSRPNPICWRGCGRSKPRPSRMPMRRGRGGRRPCADSSDCVRCATRPARPSKPGMCGRVDGGNGGRADFVRVSARPFRSVGGVGFRWPQATDREIQRGDLDRAGCDWRGRGLPVRCQPVAPVRSNRMPNDCNCWRRF